jgi:hypothetical protein
MKGKYLMAGIAVLMIMSACKKETVENPVNDHPKMNYTVLNLELKSWSSKGVDIDGDNKKDFAFEVFPVGDAVQQRDKYKFYAYSTIHTSLLSNDLDFPPMLETGEMVKPLHPGYSWWPITASELAQKVVPVNGPIYWEGVFKNASKKYLPIKMTKNDLDYFGWIELSIDQAESKLIVHRIALSTEAGKVVKTGF